MKTKKFTFIFAEPVKSMDYLISGDDVICDTIEKAKKIIKKEYPNACIKDWKSRDIEIYESRAHRPNVITAPEDLDDNLIEDFSVLEDE